jgi:hypothetical protein
VVIWRKSKKMNVDGVDSNSETDEAKTNMPPDIADEANAAKQDLLPKKSFCEKKTNKTFSLYLVIFFLLYHCS